ncbi:MAG: asparaginase [Lachnospiraceae bacterium]|nr:asparaginase [Lachnospiraceae bacterium]
MKTTKVLVVFTGGTIGSAPDAGYLAPGGEKTRRLLLEQFAEQYQNSYEKQFDTIIHFENICPYEILSENLSGDHLEMLWKALSAQLLQNEYDGVIVTVGTDTLAYSSAALGYMFADTQIPIVTVSANYPLTDERSNGLVNFEKAIHLILEGCHKGVFCSYNNGGKHYFHYGTRLLQQTNYSDLVYSVLDNYYATVENCDGNDMIVCNMKESREQKDCVLTPGKKSLAECQIAFIRPCPGMWLPTLDGINAVLIDTYHSGTFPVADGKLAAFLDEAKEKQIPVFVVGVPEGMTYETTKLYVEKEAHVLPQASPIAMYIKMWLLLSSEMDLETYMMLPLGMDIV